MASIGIRCGGNRLLECEFLRGNRNWEKGCVGVSSVKMKASCGQKFDHSLGWKPRMVAVNAAATKAAPWSAVVKKEETKKGAVVYHEKMEEWMRDSVVEIVQNLKKAPLLVHVYSEDDKDDDDETTTKLKTEKAREEENWAAVMERWRKEQERMPEGVIFVDKIGEEGDNVDGGGDDQVEDMSTREWGIVVQGKGVDCAPICYLLKTSGVDSGLGLRCTHFCLMRVKSFRETARSQLKNSWLLGGY